MENLALRQQVTAFQFKFKKERPRPLLDDIDGAFWVVLRYLPRRPADPDQVKRWVAFLTQLRSQQSRTPGEGGLVSLNAEC